MTKRYILRNNDQYTLWVNELFAEMNQHTEESLNRRPTDGGWSVIQNMYHLILSEELSLAYVRKKIGFNAVFDGVTPWSHGRSFLLWLSLRSPIKFKAPAFISKEALPEYASLSDTRDRWLKARADWTDFLQNMPDDLVNKAVYKHPRAGKLGWGGTLQFFKIHFKRHRSQMRRALVPRPVVGA